MKKDYNHQEVEPKWQAKWESDQLFQHSEKQSITNAASKMYLLFAFAYPSGSGLHVGHVESKTALDILARYYRMAGKHVFFPVGWDAFGLPAENYAVKTGVHPAKTTVSAIDEFRRQIKRLGISYDWANEIATSHPGYYQWTQWLFLELYKAGLAYKKPGTVNWCPSCQTVLANEQVVEGACERCDTEVVQKEMDQWYFKITQYTEELISGLDEVDWPEPTKQQQLHWIAKKSGINITYPVVDEQGRPVRFASSDIIHNSSPNNPTSSTVIPAPEPESSARSKQQILNQVQKDKPATVTCFTTRPDTNFGATFVVLGPEHPFVEEILKRVQDDKAEEIKQYVETAKNKKEIERLAEGRKKTGVFTGYYVEQRLTGEKLPLYISDFVLGHVGTGAVVGVPGHDMRDFQFAQAMDIPVKRVVIGPDGDDSDITSEDQVQEAASTMINSEFLDGMEIQNAIEVMMDHLEKEGLGKRVVSYKLRDWLISRQRYWGAPIPIVYDPDGQPHPVKEEHLPWTLPEDVDYNPKGKSPLASSKEFFERTEKLYGKGWTPEVDTMDTFVCSSWYYLRYMSSRWDGLEHIGQENPKLKTRNSKQTEKHKDHTRQASNFDIRASNLDTSTNQSLKQQSQALPFDLELTAKWLPVDFYMIGPEHIVLHLLYSRFFTKFLRDQGYISFNEPFMKMRHQGMILGPDGKKMSKSKGNVINPDAIIEEFGADTLRMYEMFMGPIEADKPWNPRAVAGVYRFLTRLWRLSMEALKANTDKTDEALIRLLHQTIRKVSNDIPKLKFNTSIASMMELTNAWQQNSQSAAMSVADVKKIAQLLAPFAPFIAEEIWHHTGETDSIHTSQWPTFDPELAKSEQVVVAVQINGKLRGQLEIDSETVESITESELMDMVMADAKLSDRLKDQQIKKTIWIPPKGQRPTGLLSIVV